MNTRILHIVCLVLIGALIASLSLNVYLYQEGRDYYVQLNTTRLDPLDIRAFSDTDPLRQHDTDRPLVVFFGDSRAAAWPAPGGLTSVQFMNMGVGAQTSSQVLGRVAAHIVPLRPDILVLQVGINDLKTIPLVPQQKDMIIHNCKTNIQAIITSALDAGVDTVIVTTIFPLGDIPLERQLFWSDEVASAIDEVNHFIRSRGGPRVTVLDSGHILADNHGTIQPQYQHDFLHLNTHGYAALNQELIPLLRP